MEIKERINRIREELLRHQHLYYVLSRPEISDLEYDKMFDELVELEKKHPEFDDENSPAKRVGSDITNTLPEVEHTIPVLSLDKAYSSEDVMTWIGRTEKNINTTFDVVIEEKIDGSSVVLYYEQGKLKRGVTRGNGYVGNDITENVKTIPEVPLTLTEPIDCVVRGEIYMPLDKFEECNKQVDGMYANPRNLASGVLRRVKSSETAKFPLHIFIYEGYFEDKSITKHTEILLKLEKLGFKTNPSVGVFRNNGENEGLNFHEGAVEEIPDYISSINDKRKKIEYEIDGLVIKINKISIREDLGFTGHHPKWAVAYKFESPQAQTFIKDITVQVGRSGRITPLAILGPVALAGSTISKATLHNQAYIDMLELSIEDKVTISKRGDVIPAVEKVVEKNEVGNPTFKLPNECPCCGSILKEDGAHLFCKNRGCKDRVLNNLKFFVSRGQMDIENLGGKTIELLFNEGFINSVPEIYRFNYSQLMDREGFGERKIQLIREAVEKSKEKPFMTVLSSLGFDELGKKASELLIKNGYNSFEKIIALFSEDREEELLKIDGFGEKTVIALKENFNDGENLRLIQELIDCGLTDHDAGFEEVLIDSSLEGTKWVVTGSFENFKPRELAKEEIIKRGGETTAAVSKKITHLLVGENPGSKYDKGVKLGINIVTEEQFLEMIKN